jgi:hypothetical protein
MGAYARHMLPPEFLPLYPFDDFVRMTGLFIQVIRHSEVSPRREALEESA